MTPGLSKDILCHVWPYCSKQYGAEREGGRGREREEGRGKWLDLGHLMTPGLGKDIWCHVWPYCSKRMVQRGREGERERERERGREGEVGEFGLSSDTWS